MSLIANLSRFNSAETTLISGTGQILRGV